MVDFNADEKESSSEWACVLVRHEVSTNLVEPFEVLQHQSAGGLGVLRLVLKGTAEKCGAFTSSVGKAVVGWGGKISGKLEMVFFSSAKSPQICRIISC